MGLKGYASAHAQCEKIKCTYSLYLGSSKPRLVDNVQKHLIKFGWHPQFWVWKGPRPT